jgi:hypothetical protein
MSWQATAWAIEQTTGSPGAKLMLLTLANYADDTGCCWPSQETLARDTEQSLDSVQRYLRKLEKLKLIRKVARSMGPGRWASRTYFLAITVAKISKPRSAAQLGDVDRCSNGSTTMPQDARDHAATNPSTIPHHARDYAAPVRCEPSLKPESEPSLKPSSALSSEIPMDITEKHKPEKRRPPAAERQKSFSEGRKGVEIIQNRIAQKIGFDGWVILQSLDDRELQSVTALEERGALDAAAIERLRLGKDRSLRMR